MKPLVALISVMASTAAGLLISYMAWKEYRDAAKEELTARERRIIERIVHELQAMSYEALGDLCWWWEKACREADQIPTEPEVVELYRAAWRLNYGGEPPETPKVEKPPV